MNDQSRTAKFLKDYAPPEYAIKDVSLDIQLAPKDACITSTLKIEPGPQAAGKPLVLDGDGLRLKSISLNGE
ncbi:MAG: hypothetical protein AAF405_09235, partial [Pseudomonadota bacterium]